MMEIRREILLHDSVLQGNKFSPDTIEPVNSIYSVNAGKNYVEIKKSSPTNASYGRAKQTLLDLGLQSGKTYTLTAKIADFSRSNLTGLIYIADSSSNIKAQTAQINELHVGDKLKMVFTYDPSTMKELSFYMNRDFNVTNGTYIKYADIYIL